MEAKFMAIKSVIGVAKGGRKNADLIKYKVSNGT